MYTLSKAVTVAALCLLASTAHAQAGKGAKDSAEYRAAIEDALQEFSIGNFPEARAAFSRAHELYPNARTLRGMGMSAFEARDYVEAIDLLSAAAESAEQPLTEAQRLEARQVIERAKGYVSTVEVELLPPGAALAVDGQPVQLEQGQLVLNPGDYQVQARAEGREPVTLTISAEAGRSTTITISLPRTNSGDRATDAAERSVWPYVVGGTGVALLVASAITGALSAGAEDDLRESCDTGTCDEDARDSGKTMQVATNVLLPLGGALLVGGVVWWLVDAPSTESTASRQSGLSVSCGPGACVAQARGVF